MKLLYKVKHIYFSSRMKEGKWTRAMLTSSIYHSSIFQIQWNIFLISTNICTKSIVLLLNRIQSIYVPPMLLFVYFLHHYSQSCTRLTRFRKPQTAWILRVHHCDLRWIRSFIFLYNTKFHNSFSIHMNIVKKQLFLKGGQWNFAFSLGVVESFISSIKIPPIFRQASKNII